MKGENGRVGAENLTAKKGVVLDMPTGGGSLSIHNR